jgi:hypothetical protein
MYIMSFQDLLEHLRSCLHDRIIATQIFDHSTVVSDHSANGDAGAAARENSSQQRRY